MLADSPYFPREQHRGKLSVYVKRYMYYAIITVAVPAAVLLILGLRQTLGALFFGLLLMLLYSIAGLF